MLFQKLFLRNKLVELSFVKKNNIKNEKTKMTTEKKKVL